MDEQRVHIDKMKVIVLRRSEQKGISLLVKDDNSENSIEETNEYTCLGVKSGNTIQ